MLPKKGKGQFMFRPTGATSGPIVADVANAANTDDSSYGTSPVALPSGNSSLNLEQLTAAANKITRASQQQQQTPSGTHDPNIMPSSALSSFFRRPLSPRPPLLVHLHLLVSVMQSERYLPQPPSQWLVYPSDHTPSANQPPSAQCLHKLAQSYRSHRKVPTITEFGRVVELLSTAQHNSYSSQLFGPSGQTGGQELTEYKDARGIQLHRHAKHV